MARRRVGGVLDTGDVDRDEDCQWLERMLVEYRELLDYLREH
jgi:hypothetical protein